MATDVAQRSGVLHTLGMVLMTLGLLVVFALAAVLSWSEEELPASSDAQLRAAAAAAQARIDARTAQPDLDESLVGGTEGEGSVETDGLDMVEDTVGEPEAAFDERDRVGEGIRAIVPGDGSLVTHTVVPGEQVDQVAYRYGVRPGQVRPRNGISRDTKKLKAGASIKVPAARIPPPRQPMIVRSQPTDTWWSVAIAYGVSSKDLRAYNWKLGNKLQPDAQLVVWVDPVVYDWIRTKPSDDQSVVPIRRGAVGIGPPQNGRLVNGVPLPEGKGYKLHLPGSSFGTTAAVRTTVDALTDFRIRSGYEGTLRIGAMSRVHGGPLPGHVSHQTGRDLDVRLPLRAGLSEGMAIKPDRVDWRAVWFLVDAFTRTGEVVSVFLDYGLQERVHEAAKKAGATDGELDVILQYPRGSTGYAGYVRHASGHTGHIHVRFRCGPQEVECAPSVAGVREGEAPPKSPDLPTSPGLPTSPSTPELPTAP